jgi:copper chaperone CopZ
MKKWDYSLNCGNIVYGSFDYGQVEAETEEEAIKLAKKCIEDEVDEMNEVLTQSKGGQSFGVDVDDVEVTEVVESFNLRRELLKMFKEFDGQEFNGLVFSLNILNDKICQLHITKELSILCTPFFEGDDGIQLELMDINAKIGSDIPTIVIPCGKPKTQEEFAEFKKFYIGQLNVVQGKFARVDSVSVNMENKTYTVKGLLIPKQTIAFTDFSDWNCLADINGNSIVDCQIDLDGTLQFQYVDYDFDADVEEGVSQININDTKIFGSSQYIIRDYRTAKKIELIDALHPLTENILEQFYVKYSGFGEDGDDETRIMLDEIIRANIK